MHVGSHPQYPLPGVPPMDVLTVGMGDLGFTLPNMSTQAAQKNAGGDGDGGGGWGDTLKDILGQFGAAGARIIEGRYSVPDLDPGTVYQTGKAGTTVSKQVPGTVVGVGTGQAGVAPGLGLDTGTLLIAGAVVMGLVFVMKRGGR